MNTKVLTALALLSIAAAPLPAFAQTTHTAEHVTFHGVSGFGFGGCMFFQTDKGGGQLGVEVGDATYYVMGLGPSSPYFHTAAIEIMTVSTSRYSLGTQTINFEDYGANGTTYSDCKTWPTAVGRIAQ